MYWGISFIYKKSEKTSNDLIQFLMNKFQLNIGDNENSYFGTKKVVVFLTELFDNTNPDYDELCVSISNQLFTKENFDNELEPITNFVNQCFQCNPNLEYALCSYELNGYLIGQVKKLQDFSANDFLKRFPVIYKRINPADLPHLKLNAEAQEIFT